MNASYFTSKDLVFDVVGVEDVKAALAASTDTLKKHVVKAINTTLINIDRASKQLAPVGISGQLRAGIHSRFATEKDENPVGLVECYAKHSAFMEFGTARRGASTYKGNALAPWYKYGSKHAMPPVTALIRWAHLKGLATKFGIKTKNKAAATRAAAFLVARGINRKGGLAARNYFFSAGAEEMKPHEARMEKAIKDSILEMSQKGNVGGAS